MGGAVMSAANNAAPDCAGRNGAQSHGKHTPGPWEYRGDGLYAAGDNYPFLCGWDDGSFVGCNDPVDAANIRLIAAAPELLAALKEARDALNGAPNTCGLHTQIDAAIAKAEGRS